MPRSSHALMVPTPGRIVAHEGLRPVCQQRLACQERRNQGTERCEKKNAPASIGEPYQQTKSDQDSNDTHPASSSWGASLKEKLIPSSFRQQSIDIGARLVAEICAVIGEEIAGAFSALRLQHCQEFRFGIEL